MKKVLVFIIVSFSLIFGTVALSHEKEKHQSRKIDKEKYAWKVNWNLLKDGMKKAAAEKKPMLVDFSVYEGCHRCEFMQKYVYSNDEIVDKINSDFIPILIDLAKTLTAEEKALGEKYDYKEECLFLFLSHNNEVIHNQEGEKMCFADKIEPQVFIDYLDYILNSNAQSNTN